MKKIVWALILLMVSSVYATEWGGQSPWDMKEGYTDWQRCRYRGVDLIGLGKLVHFDPAKTNEHGVLATFQFTDMMKGEPGEYVVTIPDDMRDPLNMVFDMEEWNRTKQLGPWQWKESESYGCLCISNISKKIRMVDWVVPKDQWESFKGSVDKERSEFEAYVTKMKKERRQVEQERDKWVRRKDIEIEEKEARRELLSARRHEIFIQLQQKGWKYFIFDYDWDDPGQTWE